ncbi:MAG: hypothetical protein AAGE61_18150 [Pseudomonadota bacterium]
MDPHPDFEDRTIPQNHDLGVATLRMLTKAELDEDMAAIEDSHDELIGIFGGRWPEGLTREADLIDLCWHEREFSAKRSFAWIVADPDDGSYQGCAYVYPDIGTRGRAKAYFWLRSKTSLNPPLVRRAFADWVTGPDWPKLKIEWPSPSSE